MRIVKESLINENNKLELSAGLVVIQDNKILLVHPRNAPWWKSYSIPKGHVEEGEEIIDAAIRETEEETGIKINKGEIKSDLQFIDYTNKRGDLYKRVYYYIVRPSAEIHKKDIDLQPEEVDWAGFLTAKEAEKRIFWRFKRILNLIR